MPDDSGVGALAVRRARREEGEPIADVWLRSRRAAFPAIPSPVHTDDEVRQWFREVVLVSADVWVAEHEADLVSVMVLDGSTLDELYVVPEWTGLGVGSRLLGLAKNLRPGGLDLWTFQSNVRARRFYEDHGFQATGTTDGANEEQSPDVRYVWGST